MEDEKDNLIRYVLFRIYGKELEPSEVTMRLQHEPSLAYRRGELNPKTGRPRPFGMWQISSKHQIEADELGEHISWILDQLEPVRQALQEIMRSEGVQADLYCSWEIEGNGGVMFTPALLGRIVSMNLELGVEIFYSSND